MFHSQRPSTSNIIVFLLYSTKYVLFHFTKPVAYNMFASLQSGMLFTSFGNYFRTLLALAKFCLIKGWSIVLRTWITKLGLRLNASEEKCRH